MAKTTKKHTRASRPSTTLIPCTEEWLAFDAGKLVDAN